MMKTSITSYNAAKPITNWGCHFDSLTELKFAVSIMEDYAFLRNQVSIYYHPGTLQPTSNIRRCHRRYTPDFLIRHKGTGKAFLVEIKPRAFEHHPQLLLRKEVAANYIRFKNYDWSYKVVFDDEIILTERQWLAFEDCRNLKSNTHRESWFNEYTNRLQIAAPSNKQIDFVIYGYE